MGEQRVTGRVMDIEYDDSDELYVQVAVRTVDGNRRTPKVFGVTPYLFIHADSDSPKKNPYLAQFIDFVSSGFESYDGYELLQVGTHVPSDVRKIREKYDTTWEADVPFDRRCTADYDMSGYVSFPDEESFHVSEIESVDKTDVDTVPPRACVYDIEVRTPDSFYDEFAEEAPNEVTAITAYDSYEQEYTLFALDPDLTINPSEIRTHIEEHWEGHERANELSDIDIVFRRFGQENNLLESFAEYVSSRQFDVFTGWNAVEFDHEYIISRMHKLNGVSPHKMSDIGSVGGRNTQTYVDGVPAIDMMEAFCEKLSYGEWESQSLDYVSNTVLNGGKVEGDDVNFDANRTKFMAYNVVDTQLCVELDNARGILSFWYLLAEVTAIPPYEVGTTMTECEGYLFKHRDYDEILPSTEDKELEGIDGGLVLPPYTGVKDWVGVFDLKSLYPSSIITCNISKETMTTDPEEADIIVPDMPLNYEKVAGDTIESEDIGWEPGKGACVGFTLDEQGILPKYLTKLFDERATMKSLRDEHDPDSEMYTMYNQQQRAIKVVMNSFFGVSDHPYFRLSADGLGAAITSVSRYVSWGGVQAIEEEGKDVIYGDSVTGDTLVRTPEVDVKIEDLFPVCDIEGKAKVDVDGLEVLSVDEQGNEKYGEVNEVIRHKTEKDIFEIETESGRSIRVTEDHSLLKKGEDGSIEEVSPTHIQTGCLVPVDGSLQRVSGEREVTERVDVSESEFTSESARDDSGRLQRKVRSKCPIPGQGGSREKKREYGLSGDRGEAQRALGVRRVSRDDGRIRQSVSSRRLRAGVEQRNDRGRDEDENGGRELSVVAREERGSSQEVAQRKPSEVSRTGEELHTFESSDRRNVDRGEGQENTGVASSGRDVRAREVCDSVWGTESSRFLGEQVLISDGGRLLLARMQDVRQEAGVRQTEEKSESGQRVQPVDCGERTRVTQTVGPSGRKRESRRCNYEEVVSIERVDSEESYVYDLSVEDTETFWANGVYVHNTDSLMVSMASEDEDDIDTVIEDMESLESAINGGLGSIADTIGLPDTHPFFPEDFHGNGRHAWVYEAEKLYRRFLQAGTKKRYAGNIKWKEGKKVDDFDASGFEVEKSDATTITQHTQKEFMMKALEGESFEELTDFVQSEIHKVEQAEYPLVDLGFPSTIKKPLEEYPNMPVKRAAMYSNRHLGYDWQSGRDPWLVYVDETPPGKPNTDVIAVSWTDDELPDGFRIDANKHIQKAIQKPLESLLPAFGFTWEELKTGRREQSFLGDAGSKSTDAPMFDDTTGETSDPFADVE